VTEGVSRQIGAKILLPVDVGVASATHACVLELPELGYEVAGGQASDGTADPA